MQNGLAAVLAIVLSLLAVSAQSEERNDLPSCYTFIKLEQYKPEPSGRTLIVAIDETTQLPKDLKNSAYTHVLRYVKPGDVVRMYQFSAYLSGNYMKLQFAGHLERSPDSKVRDNIGMDSLRQLDGCLGKQVGFFKKTFGEKMVQSFAKPGSEIAKSDIIGSLKKISEDVSYQGAKEKVVLLISDMLENSAYTSFYSNGRIREIDPKVEMQKVIQKGLLADFSGARVYVLAAGLVPSDIQHGYRSGPSMQKLESFWRDYFSQSNAQLVSFGTPSLTVDLK